MNRPIVLVLLAGVMALLISKYTLDRLDARQLDRGKQLSAYLETSRELIVPPEQAKYFNVIITTTDVQLSIDQFTVFEAK